MFLGMCYVSGSPAVVCEYVCARGLGCVYVSLHRTSHSHATQNPRVFICTFPAAFGRAHNRLMDLCTLLVSGPPFAFSILPPVCTLHSQASFHPCCMCSAPCVQHSPLACVSIVCSFTSQMRSRSATCTSSGSVSTAPPAATSTSRHKVG